VSVGVVMVRADFDFNKISGVRDSKKMTERERAIWCEHAGTLYERGDIACAVSFASAAMIDERGIVPAISNALALSLKKIHADPQISTVLLDGSLMAPPEFINQKTIIRGDETEPLISFASVIAKVTRDRLMTRLAKWHPQYGFDVHKGYGTEGHRAAIRAHGLSPEHRASFCKAYI
jgi:ribonuclease HII